VNATICTIGFAGKTAEEFFSLLSQAGVQKLIDIRENRVGQLSGFAKYPDITFFLNRIAGIGYTYEPRLAPSPEIRKTYRSTKDWPLYEASFLQLMRDRDVPQALELSMFEGTVALLCSEPQPEKCHRRLVAELFAQYLSRPGYNVEVRHLIIDKKGQSPQRKKRNPSNTASHDRVTD
jgi:uncharacterized protein (DUF488 family)